MKIKAILFDLDGVLIDSPDAIWKAHNLAAKKLGYPTCKREDIYRLIGMKWDDLIAVLIPDADIELFKKTANEISRRIYKNVNLLGDAKNVLKKLKKMGFKIGLVSGSNRMYSTEQLTRLKVDLNIFDVRINAEDTIKHKPDPDPLLLALKKLKVKPEQAIYVGDSLLDFRAAKSAGVNFIGALSGVTMVEEFLSNNVIYFIKDIGELPHHFKKGRLVFSRKSITAIVKYDGKILLMKRSDKVATYPNQWSFVHGRIENGETPEKRAEIEIKEETGLDVEFVKKFKEISFYDEKLGIEWHILPVLFKAKSYKVKLNWENTDYLWVKPEDAEKYNKYFAKFKKILEVS
ncbi:MAG: HAD-IA family hydrolase [Candidatus Aenigmatarchaeota archaeon]